MGIAVAASEEKERHEAIAEAAAEEKAKMEAEAAASAEEKAKLEAEAQAAAEFEERARLEAQAIAEAIEEQAKLEDGQEDREGRAEDLDVEASPENSIEENTAEKAKLEAQAEIAKA